MSGCDSSGSGSGGTTPTAGMYRGGNQGGRDKFPMVQALAVVAMAMFGMARHNSQPLGNNSGCN